MKNRRLIVLAALFALGFNSAAEARFLQTDPVGYGPDLNWYAYVQDDPSDKTDPSGNQPMPMEAVPVETAPVAGANHPPDLGQRVERSLRNYLSHIPNYDEIMPPMPTPSEPPAVVLNELQPPNIVIQSSSEASSAETSSKDKEKPKEHTKNKRPSTREKHQKGAARGDRDRGGEKGDKRRPYQR